MGTDTAHTQATQWNDTTTTSQLDPIMGYHISKILNDYRTSISPIVVQCLALFLRWATSPSSSYELLGLVAQPLFTVSPTRITGAGGPGTPGPDPQTPDPRESL